VQRARFDHHDRSGLDHVRESNRQSSPERPPPSPARRGALLLPPAIVLAIALIGSVGVHLPIYAGLGALASVFASRPPRARSPSSIEISIVDPEAGEEPERAGDPDPVVDEDEEEEARRPEVAREDAVERAVPVPAPEPPPVTPAQPTPPRPPPSQLDERRAIVQRSRDPNVESPEDAQFIADEAQDVEEETVAEITNTLEDAPDPQTSSERAETAPTETEGDSEDEVVADLRDVEGDDRRRVTLPESERDRTRPAESDPSTSPTPGATGGDALDPGVDRAPRQGERVRSIEGGAVARGGGEPSHDEVIVSDGFGSFTVRVPRDAPTGSGAGEGGGARAEGRGLGATGGGLASGRAGRTRGGAREGGAEGARGEVQLGLSWSQFEGVYGEERLERERLARLEERRSRSRGASRAQRWEQFRSAIENYVSEVRTGNQTALDAAASPFATFLSDMHRRIHREFADRYLAAIPIDASEDLNNPSLNTTLEIAVNPDGTIHRVGVVATSGNILFDFGAFNSVMRAQPFPRPPSIILSGDGHAWLHWRFDRGPRQCGTWNARPFLLENAPLIDRGEPPEIDPAQAEVEGG
jgi:outer membrane biosynthesis protein TonB